MEKRSCVELTHCPLNQVLRVTNMSTQDQYRSGTGQGKFLVGVLFTCMCGLMLQIMETRVLSVVGYYHLAFFAIGIAMLGMTAGALYVFYAFGDSPWSERRS